MDIVFVVFLFVTVIVAISVGGGVFNNYIKIRAKEARNAQPDADLAAELDDLRGRIETLEAIVTDEKYQLDRQIRELQQ